MRHDRSLILGMKIILARQGLDNSRLLRPIFMGKARVAEQQRLADIESEYKNLTGHHVPR